MLENDFTPANRHPKMDASQINEHLDNMSIRKRNLEECNIYD